MNYKRKWNAIEHAQPFEMSSYLSTLRITLISYNGSFDAQALPFSSLIFQFLILNSFHSYEWTSVSPNNVVDFTDVLSKFNVGEDCPVFDGMYNFCKLYTGGSLDGARKLVSGQNDIAIKYAPSLLLCLPVIPACIAFV